MKIFEFSELRQPSQGLVIEPHEVAAHPTIMLGSTEPTDIGAYIKNYLELRGVFDPEIKPLFPDGDSSAFLENYDLQRNGLFDPYDCVTCAHQSGIDISEKAQWNELPKQSRRFTAVDSGTVPGRGNSNSKVQASIKRGMVAETDFPSISSTTTQDQFFTKPDASVYAKEDFKDKYNFWAIPLPTYDGINVNRRDLFNASFFGPVVVSVNGTYIANENGWIIRQDDNDSHDVLIVRPSKDATTFDKTADSENPGGFTKFDPHYTYHYPYLIYVTKKKSMFQLAKTNLSPAVFLLCEASMSRFGVADGDGVTGGELLKSFSGSYKNAGIKVIDESEMNAYAYVGDIKATLFNK